MTLISCNERQKIKNLSYDKISIEFCGLKKEYWNKCNLEVNITDSVIIHKLNSLKSKSEKDYFTPHRPVLFEIDIRFFNSITKEKLLLSIVNTTYGEVTVSGKSQYINQEFFDYISKIIKLKEIKEFNGELNQEDYEKFFE